MTESEVGGVVQSFQPTAPDRQPFVGRAQELAQLHRAFDSLTAERGLLLVVVGEPGIGKTAICEQLGRHAIEHGARVMVGQCYQQGAQSLPYMPFIEVMRSYVLERDVETLRAELGAGGTALARIVPELRERLGPAMPPDTVGVAGDDRYRLFQAVSDFFRLIAMSQPLVLVLEDLHDADSGTLELLLHLSRHLARSRLLVLGTYRDVDVDRAHPLSSALAELRRSSQFERILLRGLTVEQVHGLLEMIGTPLADRALAEAVRRQTEGNPLFVHEVARLITDEGVASREHADTVLERIPEGLRDVIGKRLSRLSEETNRVLAMASVIGREFRLDVLQEVADVAPADVERSLAEAHGRSIIEERPAAAGSLVFGFSHALVRQTLYEELFAPWRIRWHQKVASVLEKVHAGHLDDHAAELAEHFAHSVEPRDLARAVDYGELAAKRAMQVCAYSEAERLLRRALQAQLILDPHDVGKRCDLLLQLGDAMLPMERQVVVAKTVAAESFALAEAAGDPRGAGRAAMQALESIYRGGFPSSLLELVAQWARRADRYVPGDTPERVFVEVCRSGLERMVDTGLGTRHLRQALQLADELGEAGTSSVATAYALRHLLSVSDVERVEGLAERFLTEARYGLRAVELAEGLAAAGTALLGAGDRAQAEAAWRELGALAELTQDSTLIAADLVAHARLALLDGKLEEALELAQAANIPSIPLVMPVMFLPPRLRAYLGRLDERTPVDLDGLPPRRAMLLRLQVSTFLEQYANSAELLARFGDVTDDSDESGVHVLGVLLEASIRCRDKRIAAGLLRRMSRLADRIQGDIMVAYGRLLGDAAALLRRPEEARQFYEAAVGVCERLHFRPELAIVHLDLAQLLVDDSPRERDLATEHLEFAISEFQEMEMLPCLGRALELRSATGSRIVAGTPEAISADGLTAREREVCALVARGLSNRDIARELVITQATVEVHVKHVLSKLRFRSRSQIAVWFAESQPTSRS